MSDPAERVDLRLVAPALAAWCAAAIGVGGGRWAGLVIGLGFLATTFAARRRAWTACTVGLALLGAGSVSWLWANGLASAAPARWASEGALMEIEAVVVSDARHWPATGNRAASAVLPITLRHVTAHGEAWQGRLPAQLTASGDAATELDQPAGATINVLVLSRAAEPGERSVGTLSLRGPVVRVREPGSAAGLANRFREGLRAAMAHSPPRQAGLVPSLVVGDTSGLSSELKDAFKATGLSHLTAVSGTNLTLMLVFTLGLARQLGVRGWSLRLLGVAVAVAFVVVCRLEPSVLRAAAMGLVAMAATGVAGDRHRGLRALSLAVLLLVLVDPWLSRSWGFALSATASAGILWWGGPWQASMRSWAPGWLAESLAIPLAAQLATQPIVTALAAQLSIVGLAANVAAGPFVGPVTVLGLVAALVSLVSPTLAEVFGWLAGWCVQPIVLVAQIGSTAPAATWAWPARPASLAVLTIGCLLIAEVILPRVLPRRGLAIGLAVLLVIGAFREPPQPGWPGDWTVVACDVGQGGAQLIRTGAQSAILVDTGPDPDALARCLTSVGVTEIPLLVITHSHADHTAGLPGVAGRLPVTMVLVGPSISDSPNSPLAMVGLPTPTSTAAGDVVQLGSVRWTTLAAGPVTGMLASTGPEDAIANDSGVVGLIETTALRVLVTGDIEVAGQQALVASGADLRADVLVVPHHGSAKQEPTFLKAVAAPIALVQVGEHNDYGHPADTTLRQLRATGSTVFRTDLQGALAVSTDGSRVVTQR